MKVPKSITRLIDSFQSLPGIGPKSAQRLVFHLLHFPQEHMERFAQALLDLKASTHLCELCKNVGEQNMCEVCLDKSRNNRQIMVVSNAMDVFAVEKTGYNGHYHVLHGLIDPLNSIGPDEIFINELISRLYQYKQEEIFPIELILATNTTMEGESTAMYISKLIKENGFSVQEVKITRIARGLPVGGDIEYADEITLSRAIDGRLDF